MQFVEETRCMITCRCGPGKTLFGIGEVTSLQFLNKIYAKGLQNLFPRTCMALTIFVSILAAEAECGFSKLAVVEDCL